MIDPDGLRYYQRDAYEATMGAWGLFRKVLVVKATGLGKTEFFAVIAKHHEGGRGKVLVICHRKELVKQAAARIHKVTGERVGIEMASRRSWGERIVVASVQSISRPKRLERIKQLGFTLVIGDEIHRGVAPSWMAVFNAHPEALILGVTATPDRGDKKALGRLLEHVAYQMDIATGIREGWLVPFKGKRVHLKEIDLSGVKAVAGDLHMAQLDEAMLEAVEGVVRNVLKEAGDRRGPIFWPGKRTAEYAAKRLNQLDPGCAVVVTDDTPEAERDQAFADIMEGRARYLCNVAIATEGFDWPAADMVALARPTKSRPVHVQMVGRGTRPNVDLRGFPGRDQGAHRRLLITRSVKPDCLILDFVGNCGVHSLVSPVDIFAGSFTDDEVKKAKELEEKSNEDGMDPLEFLRQARAALGRVASGVGHARVVADVKPFEVLSPSALGVRDDPTYELKYGYRPASESQKLALKRAGIEFDRTISHRDAARTLATLAKRREFGLATPKQLKALGKVGWADKKLKFEAASEMIDYCNKKAWRVNLDELKRVARDFNARQAAKSARSQGQATTA